MTSQEGSRFGTEDLKGKIWIATLLEPDSRAYRFDVFSTLQRELSDHPVWNALYLITLASDSEIDAGRPVGAANHAHRNDSAHVVHLRGDRGEVDEVVEALGLVGSDSDVAADRVGARYALVDRRQNVRGIYDISDLEGLRTLVEDLRFIFPEAPRLNDGSGRTDLVFPPENLDLMWLEQRRRDQIASSDSFRVYHDFSFSDRLAESGITFRNKVTDYAGKDWIPNHYDHGNGVAIADVDGDDRVDLYLTSQVGGNELWRNVGGGRFENITTRAGVALRDRVNVTASFADIENDGDPDLFVTSVRGGNTLFRNDGMGHFTDITQHAGVAYSGHSSSAVFFDYNRDGLLDLLVLNVGKYTSDSLRSVNNGTSPEQSDETFLYHRGYDDAFTAHLNPDRSESSILYENLGDGRFANVTDEVGLSNELWSGDATPIDANQDGWPDLYVLNMQGNDELYENVDGERFIRKSEAYFPATPWGSMGVKSFDYNNDGLMDLFVTDMHSDMSESVDPSREQIKSNMMWPENVIATPHESIFGNAFYERTGAGYREISDRVGAENYWPWGLSVGDLNADGFLDVFISSSMNYPFRYGVNSVLLNDQGQGFLDSEYILGIEPRRENRILTPWFTLDCDRDDVDHKYCIGRTGDVLVWGALGSRSSAIFDVDSDGDLDVITNDFNSAPMVLISDLSDRKEDLNFLKIALEGTSSNRDGLGAKVSLYIRNRALVQVYDGLTGYLSHGIHPLYFGLGAETVVDSIRIDWPSGKTQLIRGPIPSNQHLVLTEE